MRTFYLKSLDPDEEVVIVSAPKQDVKGDKAYGSMVPHGPAKMTITNIE